VSNAFSIPLFVLVLSALAPADPAAVSGGEAFLLAAASVVVAALVAMVALVILEVLLPTGTLPAAPAAARLGPAGTRRSCASRCGTVSAGSCAAGRSRDRRRPPPAAGWPGRCARRWTRAG
jgi:ubiquinone biosynthesis protein